MTKENATKYFTQAMQMLDGDDMHGAMELFTKTIECDPDYTEAYLKRSSILRALGNTEAAEADRLKARSLKPRKTNRKNIGKIDLTKVENIYEDPTLSGIDDELDFEDEFYDYAFSDDILESDNLLDSLTTEEAYQTGYPAILEFLNGSREEVPYTHLFEPSRDELTLFYDDQGEDSKTISLAQLSCIRLTKVPSMFARNKNENCHVEIIETFDGNIYHESIHPVQNQKNVLFGFSTKKETRFKYTIIPLENIKKRFQRRHLGQILLDKNLLPKIALRNALDEHSELKKIKFGRIIAEQANLLYSAVEKEIERAYKQPNNTLKTGEILLKAGLVNEEQIQQALLQQKRLHNRKLGHFLIDKGVLQEKDVYMSLAEKFRIPFVDLRQQKGSKKALSLLPREVIMKLKVLPLSVKDGNLVVATLLPDPSAICEIILKYSSVKDVTFVLAQPSHLRNVIKMLFQKKKQDN